ncbi:MAG TPA: hypothetical protein VKA91_00130 [Nitrososphaeraceae archaeon]|nr:hypothetical protein [Nitrososphaeraceae archaeon]
MIMQRRRRTMAISGVVAIVAAFGMIESIFLIENQAFAQQQVQAIPFTLQNTSMYT